MRLGIRRKLIGTLILVGLFPLAISLVVILVGGATIQLTEIRGRYEDTASMCSDQISDTLLHEELEKLLFVTKLPRITAYVRAHSAAAIPPAPPAPSDAARELDRLWPSLEAGDARVSALLKNEASDRLLLLSEIDGHPRHTFISNAAGELIAADSKTDDFFQADEPWWQQAYNGGKGRLYMSSLTTSTGGQGRLPAGDQVVEIALPIYETVDGQPRLIGILKDELSVSWLLHTLREIPTAKGLSALTQLVDLKTHKTVYSFGGDGAGAEGPATLASENFYMQHPEPRVHALTLLSNHLIMGSMKVGLRDKLLASPAPLLAEPEVPDWAVVVSKPTDEAMNRVYGLAGTVAAIGIVLILVLFILGVAISNREIILPILRLREATAAVGRGELNVRLMPAEARDNTFRKDELGDLARDFDEMTRQLQKNVNQLARSNEAKRRFMELAGHELRTPVTYLIGVCQLAQKQLQQLSAAATDAAPEDERTVALAAKNAAAVASAFGKITAKTQRLARIIDNLLKLVNNDQFTTRLIKAPVDMRALILQVTADHRPFLAERKQQLVVDVPQNLPSIDADRDKLEDSLANLVSNAIRFSPDGSSVRVSAHEVVGDMLEILVEDSGPGIPAEDLANLFEPFYTGSDIMHHHSGEFEFGSRGLGLGLAIVRRFIELHGGIVRAHPIVREGKTTGTQFQILLPLAKPDAPETAAK